MHAVHLEPFYLAWADVEQDFATSVGTIHSVSAHGIPVLVDARSGSACDPDTTALAAGSPLEDGWDGGGGARACRSSAGSSGAEARWPAGPRRTTLCASTRKRSRTRDGTTSGTARCARHRTGASTLQTSGRSCCPCTTWSWASCRAGTPPLRCATATGCASLSPASKSAACAKRACATMRRRPPPPAHPWVPRVPMQRVPKEHMPPVRVLDAPHASLQVDHVRRLRIRRRVGAEDAMRGAPGRPGRPAAGRRGKRGRGLGRGRGWRLLHNAPYALASMGPHMCGMGVCARRGRAAHPASLNATASCAPSPIFPASSVPQGKHRPAPRERPPFAGADLPPSAPRPVAGLPPRRPALRHCGRGPSRVGRRAPPDLEAQCRRTDPNAQEQGAGWARAAACVLLPGTPPLALGPTSSTRPREPLTGPLHGTPPLALGPAPAPRPLSAGAIPNTGRSLPTTCPLGCQHSHRIPCKHGQGRYGCHRLDHRHDLVHPVAPGGRRPPMAI